MSNEGGELHTAFKMLWNFKARYTSIENHTAV